MSHKHFCDFAGHMWECEGTACAPGWRHGAKRLYLRTCQVPWRKATTAGAWLSCWRVPEHHGRTETRSWQRCPPREMPSV